MGEWMYRSTFSILNMWEWKIFMMYGPVTEQGVSKIELAKN
jgi:hypothetical protein